MCRNPKVGSGLDESKYSERASRSSVCMWPVSLRTCAVCEPVWSYTLDPFVFLGMQRENNGKKGHTATSE